jgi:phosphatidylglycerol lysyltransferase
VAGFYVLRHQFQPGFDFNAAIGDVIRLATFQGEQFYAPLTREARWFTESVTLMTGVSVLYLAYSLTRPVLRPVPMTRRDRDVAAEIVQTYGSSGIAYFALGHDKSYFFNDDADCVIAYALVRGIALAAGDPIGPEEAIGPTIQAFRTYCEGNHWAPAFYQVPEQTLPLHRQVGLEALKVGEEAILDIPSFDLKGKAKDDLRSASNRGRRGCMHW